MKKILFVFMVALLALGINEANAQIRVGGGLFYFTEGEQNIGLDLRGAFGITESIDVAAKLDWNFPKSENGVKSSLLGINGDIHYNFMDRDASFTPYGLAGVNILRLAAKAGGTTISDSYFGINVGAGFEYSITESLNLFAEGKYTVLFEEDANNPIVISAGVVLPIGG